MHDPEVVLRADVGAVPGASGVCHGPEAVAGQALMFAGPSRHPRPALVNGTAGVVIFITRGRPVSIMSFTVADGRITAINGLADPARLRQLGLTAFDER